MAVEWVGVSDVQKEHWGNDEEKQTMVAVVLLECFMHEITINIAKIYSS